jgi:HlyD family secretion protein
MKKLIPWLVVLLVLAGGGYGAWRYEKSHAAPEFTWKTAPVEKRKIAAKVTASGTLQATVTVQVGAQVSGRVLKLNADFNSTVKKGELIATLDPDLFRAAVEQANANYISSQAGVTRAQAQEKDAELSAARSKALFDQSLASAADLQTADTNYTVAKAATAVSKASLAQSQASLHQAQVNLSYTNIYSPIDGTVISRAVDVGQTVAASLSAPVIFTIAEDLRKMQVHTSVAEGDVGQLQAGMAATFTVDAFPGQTFKGTVSQVRNSSTTVQNVVTYDAVIDLENVGLKLRPGMTATVTVNYSERPDALAVSNAALRFHPPPEAASAVIGDAGAPPAGSGSHGGGSHDGGGAQGDGGVATANSGGGHHARPAGSGGGGGGGMHAKGDTERRTVYILRGNTIEIVPVVTGLSDGTVTEIVRGDVKVGDQVVIDVVMSGDKSSAPATTAPAGKAPRMGRMF